MIQAKSGGSGSSGTAAVVKAAGKGPRPLSEIVTDGLVTVTPELALRILQSANYDRQRDIRPAHVAVLARQMENHEWTSGTQIHFGRLPDGMLALVNGQHRLQAVLQSQASVQFQILVTNVESNEALNRLYRRHDRLAIGRSVTDTLKAEGIGDSYGLRRKLATAVFNSMALISNGFKSLGTEGYDQYEARSDEAKLKRCAEYWDVAQIYQSCLEGSLSSLRLKLQSAGLVSVALVTMKHQEALAEPFWQCVAHQNGLNSNDPRAALGRFLLAPRGGGNNAARNVAKACSNAWNAYYKKETIGALRLTGAPIRILGTPFDGKSRAP